MPSLAVAQSCVRRAYLLLQRSPHTDVLLATAMGVLPSGSRRRWPDEGPGTCCHSIADHGCNAMHLWRRPHIDRSALIGPSLHCRRRYRYSTGTQLLTKTLTSHMQSSGQRPIDRSSLKPYTLRGPSVLFITPQAASICPRPTSYGETINWQLARTLPPITPIVPFCFINHEPMSHACVHAIEASSHF